MGENVTIDFREVRHEDVGWIKMDQDNSPVDGSCEDDEQCSVEFHQRQGFLEKLLRVDSASGR
jgi:hypothetical protein